MIDWNPLVTIVSTFFGFAAVSHRFAGQLHNKVDVVIYQAKVKELHDTINELRTELAILKDRGEERK